ncbi:methylmalonyl Co-A mutase-associated GTPase MeaB [Salisediminibacterium selenitireducens]|uniref:LAO/AO transport system ATPase n=1 Tax=Bacillus selenitireducens (strain ATCC 700615 / DSM 15326 / MLS10) TaxID=439292 RepID=D6Y0V1_BACIE|nr:methylmalonyl Co-A mutase-associated GTPase MeaB [Salisediminibacterium selenitireducens]ADI00669.1 LAO/AO transport system ATPase [[Bacillus] selenitireducens MLS10]
MVKRLNDMTIPELFEAIRSGNQRALARAISFAEDQSLSSHDYRELMGLVFQDQKKSSIAGVTGSPGAGKSTLVSRLVKAWRKEGRKVAILAVDPTSPFSGGALLGDRIRMHDHEGDPGVFIRSMGTRGSLGGLAEACQDAVRLLETAGYDHIIVETVGVGQSELDIMKVADTIILTLYPSGGDLIQAFKAGIMEIADVFVMNKADLPGVEQLKQELEDLLHLTKTDEDWMPPIIQTVATTGEGISALGDAITGHGDWLKQGDGTRRRKDQLHFEVERRLITRLKEELATYMEEAVNGAADEDPYTLADRVYAKWREEEHD